VASKLCEHVKIVIFLAVACVLAVNDGIICFIKYLEYPPYLSK
jgi:hypothetical protein